jgi:hypothetical protein
MQQAENDHLDFQHALWMITQEGEKLPVNSTITALFIVCYILELELVSGPLNLVRGMYSRRRTTANAKPSQ